MAGSWLRPARFRAGVLAIALSVVVSLVSAEPARASTPDWNLGNTKASQISNLNAQATGVVRNDGLGKCLDDWQGSTANGATVDSYHCNSTASQNWSFNPRYDYSGDSAFWGTVTPTGAASKCLSVTSTNGGKAQSVALAGSVQMIWTVSGQVWAKSGVGAGGWVKESDNSPNGIAGGSDGTQLMIGSAGLYARNTIGADPWTKEADDARKIAANGGVQMYTDGGGAVYARSGIGTTWTTEYASGAKAVSVGSDGTQMIIGSDGAVYARTSIGASTGWTKEIAAAKEIATNGGVQMLVGTDGTVYARTGIGTTWTKESGATADPDFTAAIAAGPDGTQMYIGSDNFVYAKKGVALNGWTKEGGPADASNFASSIAAGTGGLQMMLTEGWLADARASIGTTAWTVETDTTTETDNGRPVQLFDCHGWGSQQWLFQHDKTGNIQLYNPDSSKCLDTPSASTTDGTALWIHTCNGSIAQRFAPPQTPAPPSGPITNPLMGKCAVAASTTAAVAEGTAVVLYGCGIGYTTGPVIPWTLQPDGTLMAGGRCLGVTGGETATAKSTPVELATCAGGLDQQWLVGYDTSNRARLLNPNSGKCLDDPASSTTDGAKLQIFTCNNSNAQAWDIPHAGHTFAAPQTATASTLPTAPDESQRDAMRDAERVRINRAHLAMIMNAGGINVRKTVAQTLAGPDLPLSTSNWYDSDTVTNPYAPNDAITQDVNAAAIADQSRQQREAGISNFLSYPESDSPPDFTADVTDFMSKTSTFWMATDAIYADLPTAKADQAAQDRVTAIAADHSAADPSDAWEWNLYRDRTLRGSADDARRFIQYDGWPTIAPPPGTPEFRVEVEALKTRWVEGDPTNPLDPDDVLLTVEETAWSEWQNELNAQSQPRADILAAEMQGLEALQASAETMHDGLDYTWTATQILKAQDLKVHGPQSEWSGVDMSHATHDLGLIKAKVAALASAAQNEATVAQDAASKATTARNTAYATATAAGLPQGRGLSYAQQSAQVTLAIAAATQATSNAMQTAVAATNATLADSATLLANASAQAHAARALYQRQAAQDSAAQAAALATQAKQQASAAATAAAKAAQDKAKVTTVEATAKAAQQRADDAAADAVKQQQIAAKARQDADTQRQTAATATAAAQQQDAIAQARKNDAATSDSRAQADDATAQKAESDADTALARARSAHATMDKALQDAAIADAKAAAAAGTDAAADAQAAADQARDAANAAATAAAKADHEANVAENAAAKARADAETARAAANKADADYRTAQAAAAQTHAAAIKAHSLAADAIHQAFVASQDAAAAQQSAQQARSDAANAKADAIAAQKEATGALADSAVATGQAMATARAAADTATAAATVAAPANDAIALASPWAATDSAAGLSVLTSQSAKSIAEQETNVAAAQATQAAALAKAAQDAANRAAGDAKLAAQAAADAAASAAAATASAAAATKSARQASADALATQQASDRIDIMDAKAQADVGRAQTAATSANSDADAAEAAADDSERDADTARDAADDAWAAADIADEDADDAAAAAADAQRAADAANADAASAQQIADAATQVQAAPQPTLSSGTSPVGDPDIQVVPVVTDGPDFSWDCSGTGGCDGMGHLHVAGYYTYWLVTCTSPSNQQISCLHLVDGSSIYLDYLGSEPLKQNLDVPIHLSQKQMLQTSLKALPGILFGEWKSCFKKVTGSSGGHWLDCGIVLLELAAPTAMKFVVNGVRDLRLAIAAGDIEGIDSALAALKQSAIDTKALIKLENQARLARAKSVLDAFRSCLVPHSFAAGTGVLMADGRVMPIEDIRVGDSVRNAVPGGGVETHRVTEVHITTTDTEFAEVTVAGDDGRQATITGTQNHPFYSLTHKEFVDASRLVAGDRLLTVGSGAVNAVAVRNYTGTMVTYDLSVDGVPTYFVANGGLPVLVHNTCPTIQQVLKVSGLTPGKWNNVTADDGLTIENALGGNLYPGHPFIDSYDAVTKTGTSIKSVDWRYMESAGEFKSKIKSLLNELYNGKRFDDGWTLSKQYKRGDIDHWVLRVAYPQNPPAGYMERALQLVDDAKAMGIDLYFHPIDG